MISRLFLLLALGFSLVCSGSAQDPVDPTRGAPQAVPGAFLVRFAERSFDLEPLRRRVRSGASAASYADLVRRFDALVRRDQAAFVAAVEARGARVSHQWWIVNGARVVDAGDGGWLRDLPGVADVEPDRYVHVLNDTARNASHHDAVGANRRRNANGEPVTGRGVGVAVLDTGSDVLFQRSSRPHPAYYADGDAGDDTGGGIRGSRLRAVFDASGHGVADLNGHGAHVDGSVASDHPGYRGMAPEAWIIGVRISGPGAVGWATSAALVNGWQMIAAARVEHAIAVANNSFSGSPDLGSAIQVALDNAAYFADILPVCAAGNSGGNTANSQNVWNGLAVGSIDKNSLAISSFSARGPLDGFGRTYPDITAVGNGVMSIQLQDINPRSSSGTSMASPMVAGGAALVRDAVPAITALETKAILLDTAWHVRDRRNSYGLGVLDCDAAVARALAGEFRTVVVDAASGVQRIDWTAPTGGTKRFTIAWMHPGGRSFDDVDLTVRDGGTVVATDHNRLNSYESVVFEAVAGRTYQLELRRVGPAVVTDLEVALVGLPAVAAPPTPMIAAITPQRVPNSGRTPVAIRGVIDGVTRIDIGPHTVTDYVRTASDTIEFVLPARAVIGTHPVTLSNASGTSAAATLDLVGLDPPQLVGDQHRPKGSPFALEVDGQAGWTTFLFVSPNDVPSTVPRIVDLGIGANFTTLYEVGFAIHDGRGVASFAPTIPVGTSIGLWWFQGIHVDLAALVPPADTTDTWRVLSY